MIRRLAQVAEVLPKDRILDIDAAEVVQPRYRREFEVVVRFETPQNFDVTLVNFVRLDYPKIANRCIAAAVPACRCFHAPRDSLNELTLRGSLSGLRRA